MVVSVARAYIYNKDKQLLLGERAKGKLFPGLFELPGGTIKEGESPAEALIRELKEEVNLEVFSYSFMYSQLDNTSSSNCEYEVHYFYVVVQNLSDFKHNEQNSTNQWCWFSKDEMPNPNMILGDVDYSYGVM